MIQMGTCTITYDTIICREIDGASKIDTDVLYMDNNTIQLPTISSIPYNSSSSGVLSYDSNGYVTPITYTDLTNIIGGPDNVCNTVSSEPCILNVAYSMFNNPNIVTSTSFIDAINSTLTDIEVSSVTIDNVWTIDNDISNILYFTRDGTEDVMILSDTGVTIPSLGTTSTSISPTKIVSTDTNGNLYSLNIGSGININNGTVSVNSLPAPGIYGSYIYSDGTQWIVGSSNIRLGSTAGQNNQQAAAIAIGEAAGKETQGFASIAIGQLAGNRNQNNDAIAIGRYAGYGLDTDTFQSKPQGLSAIAIGLSAGREAQGDNAIAIGNNAGYENQSQYSIAIGVQSGTVAQGTDSIAIGRRAGNNNQSINAIAIGREAGVYQQSNEAIAIGYLAGYGYSGGTVKRQGTGAIAIGTQSGESGQGANSIAIGKLSGYLDQASNSIVINATGTALNNTIASSFRVKPIRQLPITGLRQLYYDPTSGEISYSP